MFIQGVVPRNFTSGNEVEAPRASTPTTRSSSAMQVRSPAAFAFIVSRRLRRKDRPVRDRKSFNHAQPSSSSALGRRLAKSSLLGQAWRAASRSAPDQLRAASDISE